MATNYPANKDTSTTLPYPSATDDTNNPSLAGLQDNQNDAVIAIETYIGNNTASQTAPLANNVLLSTAAGTSEWGQITSSNVASANSTGTGSFVFASSPTISGATLSSPTISNPTFSTSLGALNVSSLTASSTITGNGGISTTTLNTSSTTTLSNTTVNGTLSAVGAFTSNGSVVFTNSAEWTIPSSVIPGNALRGMTLFGISSAYVGTTPAAQTTNFLFQSGTNVGTTDSNGYISFSFPVAFPNGVVAVVPVSGDGEGGQVYGVYNAGTNTTSIFSVKTTVISGNIRVNWIAIGW